MIQLAFRYVEQFYISTTSNISFWKNNLTIKWYHLFWVSVFPFLIVRRKSTFTTLVVSVHIPQVVFTLTYVLFLVLQCHSSCDKHSNRLIMCPQMGSCWRIIWLIDLICMYYQKPLKVSNTKTPSNTPPHILRQRDKFSASMCFAVFWLQ